MKNKIYAIAITDFILKTKTTKLFYRALLLITIAIGRVNAQMVYLPDTNFKNVLILQGFGPAIVGDSLNAGDSLVINSTYLFLGSAGIHDLTGMEAFINSVYIDCSNNQLTTLPQLPATLQNFGCSNNQLTSLPQLPSGLSYLTCDHNLLTSLPQLPLTLDHLVCEDNDLTSLPSLPPSLTYLTCFYNSLTALPALPVGLTHLECYANQLTTLPSLPPNLTYLYCGYNQLTALPPLPSTLNFLACHSNQLTVLPTLTSSSYSFINCSDNLLTSLPILPDSIQTFMCLNNQITIMPDLPKNLLDLDCDNNLLTSLPELPATLMNLRCNGNANLSCLPKLHNMNLLEFSSTAITCIPNYPTITQSNPLIDTIPICDQFNANGCDFYWNIDGQTYSDNNANCVYDTADAYLKNIPLQLLCNGNLLQQTATNFFGNYDFDTDSLAIYEVRVDTTDLPFDVMCPGTNLYSDTISATDSIKMGRDFTFQCKGGLHVGIKSIYGRFVPGQFTTIKIGAEDLSLYYGMSCASGESGIITTTLNGPVNYINAAAGALSPTTVSGNTLTYSVPDFGAVNIGAFDVIVKTDTAAIAGTPICITVTTNTTNLSGNIKFDSLQQCFTTVSSFDPNDKEVSPVSDIDINGDGWLIYTINFQNTGTAEATDIYLLDTLDNNLDWSTFKLVDYSHQPQIQLFNTGIVRFNFPNIHLPDSNANEPLSHGYVQYKIKLKPGLSLGTQIHNTAYIYFDFNQPVVTNTTQNTLVIPTAITEIRNETGVNIYPNPATNHLSISLPKISQKVNVVISDITGKTVYNVTDASIQKIEVNTKDFSDGVYFVQIQTADFVETRKMIIAR